MAPPQERCPLDPADLSSGLERKSSPLVIVVGAGVAGLAAARALRNASFKVTVLESRDRIGGRTYTDYSFGFPVDMGASWLHGVCQKNPLAHLIGWLGLPLYRTSGDNSVLYDHDLESYALFDMEGHQVPSNLVTAVGEAFESLLEETKKIRHEFDEDISVLKAFSVVLERRPELRMDGLAYKVLQWYQCRMEGWFAADAVNISVRCWDEEELLDGGHGLMVKGYLPVVKALAEGLDIRLNHRVSKVKHGYHGVRVFTEDGKVFKADAAVITLPLGVLKANLIKFEPRLPDWKEAAITDLGVGNENKIALYFKNVFWPNVDFLGRLADDIEKISDEEAASFAVMQLKRILPHASEPVQFLVSHWGTDINSLGCYSYDAVGKPHDLYERIRIPVDNLFFAGEATSLNFPGTVHGAFSTGLIAAEECRRRFLEQYRDLALFQPVMSEELSTETVPIRISRM